MPFKGTPGQFLSHDNPFIGEYANQNYQVPRQSARFFRGMLKGAEKGDYSGIPGMGQFDDAIASGYKDIENSADPLAYLAAGESGGSMGNRNQRLQEDRLRQGVRGQQFGYVGDQLQGAARGLADIWRDKNEWNANKYGTLISGENNRYQYQAPQQGWGSQLLNTAVGAVLGGGPVKNQFT